MESIKVAVGQLASAREMYCTLKGRSLELVIT